MSLNARSLPVEGTCGPRHRSTQSPWPYRLMGSVGRNRRDDLGLVVLADVAEEGHRLIARHHPPVHRLVGLGQLLHARLDRRQVLGREGPCVGKVVVEAVLDDRADGHLGVGKQLLDRLRQQMRGGMPDDLEAVGVPVGDDGDRRVVIDHEGGIDQLAIDAARQRRARQARADALCDFARR